MTHPPTPPNCKYFESGYGQAWFKTDPERGRESVWFCLEDGPCSSHPDHPDFRTDTVWRQIASAVAYRFWMKECERIDSEIVEKFNEMCPECKTMMEKSTEANLNAVEWWNWGEK